MKQIKEVFKYIQEDYPNQLKEVKLEKGLQRRLKDETIEEFLNNELNKFLKEDSIYIKVKIGPYYNRSLIPWIHLYTEDNKKGTTGHYGGISFEKKGHISLWLGFGQTSLKKAQIIEKRNQYISEYAKIEMNLKHNFQYEQVYVDAVIISKTYLLSEFNENEFYSDFVYLMDLYKKHEIKKKFGTISMETVNEEYNDEININTNNVQEIIKGVNKLYKGYTNEGKERKICFDYLYKRDKNNELILDKKGNPIMIEASQYEKVMFHPNYKKEDFLFQVDGLTSTYIAGAFYRILKKAINYPKLNFYLIIDNFNQGDIKEIFGDTINLLKRTENGESVYQIHNLMASRYIYNNKNNGDSIYLPSNLSVLAIYNPKGKKMEHEVEQSFEIEWIESTNEELDDYYIKGFNGIKWGTLRKAINSQIEKKLNKINTEEEKIDSYFLPQSILTTKVDTEELIEAREMLTNKLLVYLFENVCTYNPNILFNENVTNLEALIQKSKSKNYIELFNDKIQEKLKQ